MLLPIKATFSSKFDTSITKEYQVYPKKWITFKWCLYFSKGNRSNIKVFFCVREVLT